jgi:hypothetical protein
MDYVLDSSLRWNDVVGLLPYQASASLAATIFPAVKPDAPKNNFDRCRFGATPFDYVMKTAVAHGQPQGKFD